MMPRTDLDLAIVDPTMPTDPHLRVIAEDVLARLKYSFCAVATEDEPSTSDDLDPVFRSYLATRSASVRNRARQSSRELLAPSPQIRSASFGRYAGVDVQEYRRMSSANLSARVGRLNVEAEQSSQPY
jgi:hypothetical protein